MLGKPLVRSERGWRATLDMDEILWHRRETRRQTENTNVILCRGESPAYSNTVQRISQKAANGKNRPRVCENVSAQFLTARTVVSFVFRE